MPDITAPHGALVQPLFAATLVNPYGLAGQRYWPNPTFVDIDGDGDLDFFTGDVESSTVRVLVLRGSDGRQPVASLWSRLKTILLIKAAIGGGNGELLRVFRRHLQPFLTAAGESRSTRLAIPRPAAGSAAAAIPVPAAL